MEKIYNTISYYLNNQNEVEEYLDKHKNIAKNLQNQIDTILVKLLEKNSWTSEDSRAIAWIGNRGSRLAYPHLLRILQEGKSKYARKAAADKLTYYSDKEQINPLLYAISNDLYDDVRKEATKSLGQFYNAVPYVALVIDSLVTNSPNRYSKLVLEHYQDS